MTEAEKAEEERKNKERINRIGEDPILQPADLLGAGQRFPRIELLPAVPRAGTSRLAARAQSHRGEAQDAANAAQPAFSI